MPNSALLDVIRSEEQDSALNYAVMAAFMASGRSLERGSLLLMMVASLTCLSGLLSTTLAATCLVLHLLLALAAMYYAWRVALDAKLFEVLAQHREQSSEFDTALSYCLGKETPAMRTVASRWSGARRLLCYQTAFVFMQAVAAIGTILAALLMR